VITVITGPYQVLDNGMQIKMEFVIMPNQKNGPHVVWPPEIGAADPIYPVPNFGDRRAGSRPSGETSTNRPSRGRETSVKFREFLRFP
jgi:hypothetical protein|tara:strand:- start:909 stop:1172 length:264 start_codon:yes stop_codon:yes gene_type:complete